jgi:hypothetical protein
LTISIIGFGYIKWIELFQSSKRSCNSSNNTRITLTFVSIIPLMDSVATVVVEPIPAVENPETISPPKLVSGLDTGSTPRNSEVSSTKISVSVVVMSLRTFAVG